MTTIRLYCPEPLGLKLGESHEEAKQIAFKDGFAVFEAKDFPDWEKWLKHPGTPPIEVLPDDSTQVPTGTSGAFVCAIDGRTFTAKIGYLGHMRSHAPKKG